MVARHDGVFSRWPYDRLHGGMWRASPPLAPRAYAAIARDAEQVVVGAAFEELIAALARSVCGSDREM